MIIHQPEIEASQGEVCLSARIETEKSIPHLPERLWYRFPEGYLNYITDRSDGFLVSLLLVAMHLGEAVQVRGVVSPRLASSLPAIQETYLRSRPKRLQLVSLHYAHLEEMAAGQVLGGVACAFSGGIDSLYTLYTRLPDSTQPASDPLTHGIFIDGFDIFLHQKGTYQHLLQKYRGFFEKLGLQLLTVRTNVYAFTQFRVDWTIASEPALVGTALTFTGLLKRFIKPGGYELRQAAMPQAGYHTIPLMSTESMQIVLDRPDLHRFEKLRGIAGWWGAQQNLRVCINPVKNEDGSACYRCAKCLNTLTFLELLGVRHKFANFPRPFSLRYFLRFCLATNDYPSYYPDNPRYYRQHGRIDLALLYFLLYIPLSIKPTLRKLVVKWLRPDWLYRLERRVYRQHVAPEEKKAH